MPARLLVTVVFTLFLSVPSSLAITLYTYTNGGSSGLWNVAGTWTTDPTGLTLVGSVVPGNNDGVVILNGFTVVLDANLATTGLSINIQNGGTLDLATFTTATINSLSGSGTLRIGSAYFPTITTNNFPAGYAAGATVAYYNFTGSIPVSLNYPNITFTNTTSTDHVISFSNATASTFTVFGNFVTSNTGSGTLSVNLGTQATNVIAMTINGNVTIGSSTTWGVGTFNAIHTISLGGNMTNNGTVDFSNGTQYATSTTGAARITFTGATDNTLACNGVTDFYTLTMTKGVGSANTLSVTSTNVANLNFYSSEQLLVLNAGTLRLGANISIPRVYGSGSPNYDIGSSSLSPMMWIDGATVNTNGSALVVYGKFRITAGSFTSYGGQGSVIREEGQYLIEGGTFNTEKFRPSTTATTHRGSFTMSGGTFNANGTGSDANYARFSMPFPEQVFIMSGGIINVSNPQSGGGATTGGIHIGCKASNYSVTGGTFNAILSGSAGSFSILSTAPFWNLNISKTGGTLNTVRLTNLGSVGGTITTAQPLVVLNDLSIDGTLTPVLDANGLAVTVGRNFTIHPGATYTPNSNTTTFNGSGAQVFSNSGTITSGLYNFTVNKTSGTLTLGGTATTYTVTNTLTLLSGVLDDGGKTILATGSIYSEAVHTGTGNITLGGASTQTISGDGNGVFGNIILNNNSVPGATVTSDIAISGTLTLAGTGNSLLDIAHNLLALTSSSATALTTTGNPFSSAKMIRTQGLQSDRGVRKTFGNLSAFTFAVGAGSDYTPATIQLTAAPTTYGTITMKPVSTRHQFVVAGNTNNLMWYWKVVSSGFTGLGATAVSHSYHYVEGSVSPAGDDATYVPARYNATTWTVVNDVTQVNETTNVISLSGVGYIDGDYTAGRPAAFGIVRIFYSKRNGNWTDTSPGTTPWSNVSHSGPDANVAPGAGDQVFIGDGGTFNHTIVITSNTQASGGLEINSGSTLDIGTTTGHNFGRLENVPISGSGTLRISSAAATAEFPAGDFGNFIRTSGGTVEYYSTGTQDFTIPLSSAAPTTLPLNSYKHLLLTPASGRTITLPNQDVRIYGNITVQGSSGTAIARLNSANARTLTVNGNILVNSGTLQFMNGTAQSLVVDGNISIGAAGTFNLAGSGTAATNTILLDGNIINNGILDLSNGTYVCNVTSASAVNTSITGTGTTTDFNILTVSKGTTQSPILEVNASSFSLSGGASPLVLNYGTFRLTSPQTVTIANGADFSIPSTARLSCNGGTMQITGGNGIDMQLAGTLEILNGTVNVGTSANDNSIEYAATGSPTITISGGNLNVRAQVRRSVSSSQGGLVYIQSGASVVSVGISSATSTTRGVFEILNTGSSFSMSGGTLSIARASGSGSIADVYLHPSAYSISGGTLETGTGTTSQTVDINTIIPLYNLSVAGTTNTARLEVNPLTLRGSLTITSTNIFQASGYNVNIAGNFSNLNSSAATGVNAGGYQPGSASQITNVNGSSAHQLITGAPGNLTNFANLYINNTFTAGTVTLAVNTNLQVNNTLLLSNGTLADGGNTITAISSIFNSSTHTSSAGGSITLAGISSQFIGGNGNGKFGNLILNNSAGAYFGADQEVTQTLTLTSGSLVIGSYELYLSSTSLSAISGATSTQFIVTSGVLSDGGVTKAFAGSLSAENFTFPIGVGSKYTPASYTITTGTTGGNITVKPVNSKHPSATGPGTAYISYYWAVSHTIVELTALTHTYTYVSSDELGNPLDYRDARFNGGAWTIGVTAGNPNTTTRVITFTNFTNLDGDYTAGEATAFVNPTTYTSIATGNWESNASWTPTPPGIDLGPPPGSFVIISVGNTITITSNSRQTATLSVRGRLHLGNTTGHNFGTVTTTGVGDRTIQIQSSTFPNGDFAAFNSTGGGTVEYNGALTLPTQALYNNLSFTGAGVKILPNSDLTLNGNLTVQNGTVNNAVNNRNITLNSSSGDFTNNATFLAGTGTIIVGRNFVNQGSGTTFVGGGGSGGLRVTGNFTNSSSATFAMGTDSLGVRGSLNNSATFSGAAGAVRISGGLNNLSGGTFTTGSGILAITGSLVNNGTYNAGTDATSIGGSLTNSGASALFNANTNAMTLNGNFTNSSSAVFNAGTATIAVSGNWSQSATFNAGTSTVTFSNTASRTLTGTTTFNNLIKTSGGSLTLNNDIDVSGSLTLTSGNITTGNNVVSLTNSTTQPLTGSSSSFIDGRLAITYPNTAAESRVYHIGRGSIYRPVTIQQNAVSASPRVRVEMIEAAPTGTFPPTLEGLSTVRHYGVNLLSGTMNSPTIQLSFNTNSPADETITVAGNVHVARATASSGPWTDEGGSGVFSPAAPAGYAISGVTSIAAVTYFSIGYEDQPLPIELRSFEARFLNGIVKLDWVTVTETNNAWFTIERSEDGLHFDSLFSLEGAGISMEVKRYHEIDEYPLPGRSYYRLRQTDYDGLYTFSNVVMVYNPNVAETAMTIYPNPAKLSEDFFLELGGTQDKEIQLAITHTSGRVLYKGVTEVDGKWRVRIPDVMSGHRLEPGAYIIQVWTGDTRLTGKLIISE